MDSNLGTPFDYDDKIHKSKIKYQNNFATMNTVKTKKNILINEKE